jgi:hypothetical protein
MTRNQKRKLKLAARQRQVPFAPKVRKASTKPKVKLPSKRVGKGYANSRYAYSRMTNVSQAALTLATVTALINQEIEVVSTSLQGLSYAFVNLALARGWLSGAAQPNYPFAAWQYMAQVWNGFLNGSVPQSLNMPYWMWAVGRAIMAKQVPKGFGHVFYKGVAALATPSVATIPLGPFAYSYVGNLYVPGSTSTDMFPNAVPPAPPTLSLQQEAFLAMCAFVEQSNNAWPAAKMCDATVKTVLDKDVSAFCTLIAETGTGYGQGGQAFLATLEVPIFHPLLSTLLAEVTDAETGSPTRFPARATCYSGDELFTSFCLSTGLSIQKWGNKIAPKFKFIDFIEFQEVMALYATQIINQYYADPTAAIWTQTGVYTVENPEVTQCPITLQEMGLLLRNEIMTVFALTQTGTQSLAPVLATSGTDIQFTPFLLGTTGVPLNSVQMKLPQPLVENIRGLIIHSCYTGAKNDVEFLVPVWGQYYNDVLSAADYNYNTQANGSGTSTPTFTAIPPVRVKLNSSKGVSSWELLKVEDPISFVDTSNGTSYVFINDINRLTFLATQWNQWISNYQAYSSPLVCLSADPGINILTSINQTRHWTSVVSQNAKLRAAEAQDMRMEKTRSLLVSPYASRQAFAISYRETPFACTTAITNQWILPVNKLQVGSASANSSTFVKIQALTGEEMSSSLSSTGDVGQTLASMHQTYALMMTHGKNADSAFDKDITALNAQGHAGILSSLAASFIGATFGSSAGNVAQSIANVLPV